MKDIYKKEICINCANENCTNRIEETQYIDESSVTTLVKCKDFICKNKRKNVGRLKI